MNPAALEISGPLGWLNLLLGTAILLLPGVAAADRLVPGWSLRWVLAPVLSLTILVVTAVAGGFLFALPVTAASTTLVALAWTVLLERRRIAGWLSLAPATPAQPPESDAPPAKRAPFQWPEVAAVAAAIIVLLTVHSMPHLAAEGGATNTLQAPFDLAARGVGALFGGQQYPYPIHVDEHVHLAYAAEVVRSATPFIGDPYTGQPGDAGLFDLQGEVHERGFWTSLAQIELLTGASGPTVAHYLPALWSAYLGVLLWAILRPAPGAAAAAALLAILPTTPLFLGTGYLVPVTFGLPWVLATLVVTTRSQGLVRLLAPLVIITCGFFIHLVAGGLCMLVGLIAALLRDGRPAARAAAAAVILLPLAWTWPAIRAEVTTNLAAAALPTSREVFLAAGAVVPGLAAMGAAVAFLRRSSDLLAHRVLAVTAGVLLVVFLGTMLSGSTSLALYYRPIHFFFVAVAALAGLGAASVGPWLLRLPKSKQVPRRAAVVAGAVTFSLVALALPSVVAEHAGTRHYQVFDETSWQALSDFADAAPEDDAVFLSHPWQAPLLNMATGAIPHAVLYPGGPPVNGADYDDYASSSGKDPQWFKARGITWVVSTTAPNATAIQVAPGIYHLA